MKYTIVALSFLLASCSNYSRQDTHECEFTCEVCQGVKLSCKSGESNRIKVNEESDDEQPIR